ncbi:chaperonin GroEL [Geminicoccus harenae]|uniref:chaperonin GroEL n=2 Tax=Geminicoccus harenae TaxID=2498453 RepID=UPI00210503A0|nr:chaperonin GroEL [Geminicoccus harenae]
MVAKVVLGESQAGQALGRGVDLAADLVATTLGPAGRAVLIERPFATPTLLRDGYAVLQQLERADPAEEMGLRAMRELAWRTLDQVGDGTSSAVVLARALLREGRRAVRAGFAAAELQDAFDRQAGRVIASLESRAIADPDQAQLEQVAAQAAGGDLSLARRVVEAHLAAGADGVVQVEEGRGSRDELDVAPGLHFDQGWISAHFVEDQETQSVEIANPLIIFHLGALTELGPILPVLEMIAKADRGLMLIADSVGGNALSTLVVNRQRAGFKVAAVKAPGTGVWRQLMLEDLAIATGGMVIGEQMGTRLEKLRPHMAGQAERIRITRIGTTITGGKGDPAMVRIRAKEIRQAIARERHLAFDREQHQRRLARLEAGIATLRIGGVTESEMAVRQRQAKAASAAVQAARSGGVLLGGSAAYLRAGLHCQEVRAGDPLERMAARIFATALAAPLGQIAGNAGVDGRAVAWQLAEPGAAGQCYDVGACGLRPESVLVDALPVARAVVRNASSTAARLLGMAVAITSRAA